MKRWCGWQRRKRVCESSGVLILNQIGVMFIKTIKASFTAHGKEENGFYENVQKIIKWREKYRFPAGVEDLFDTLNHCGEAATYMDARAFFVAYVLLCEGYEAEVT